MDHARIEHIFQFMEYDNLTESQHLLVESFEQQYDQKGRLSERQVEVLESIFNQAAGKAEFGAF